MFDSEGNVLNDEVGYSPFFGSIPIPDFAQIISARAHRHCPRSTIINDAPST